MSGTLTPWHGGVGPTDQNHLAQETGPQLQGSLRPPACAESHDKQTEQQRACSSLPRAGRYLARVSIRKAVWNLSRSSVLLEPAPEYSRAECAMPEKYVKINPCSEDPMGPRHGYPQAGRFLLSCGRPRGPRYGYPQAGGFLLLGGRPQGPWYGYPQAGMLLLSHGRPQVPPAGSVPHLSLFARPTAHQSQRTRGQRREALSLFSSASLGKFRG